MTLITFTPPKDKKEACERMSILYTDMNMIDVQLKESGRKSIDGTLMTEAAYLTWFGKANKAKAWKKSEYAYLKNWLKIYDEEHGYRDLKTASLNAKALLERLIDEMRLDEREEISEAIGALEGALN